MAPIIQKAIVNPINPNLLIALKEAKKGENSGKVLGEFNIKIRLIFSMKSKIPATIGTKVI